MAVPWKQSTVGIERCVYRPKKADSMLTEAWQQQQKDSWTTGVVILDVTLENYLSIFKYIRTLHRVSDHAFVENGVKSNIFTPKTVARTIRHSVLKSITVVCAWARDATLDHECVKTFDQSPSRIWISYPISPVACSRVLLNGCRSIPHRIALWNEQAHPSRVWKNKKKVCHFDALG